MVASTRFSATALAETAREQQSASGDFPGPNLTLTLTLTLTLILTPTLTLTLTRHAGHATQRLARCRPGRRLLAIRAVPTRWLGLGLG